MKNKVEKAIILAAGIGSRLKPLTEKTPKCLLDFNGQTLLGFQLQELQKQAVTDVVIVIGGFAKQVIDFVQTGPFDKMNISLEFNPFYQVSNNLASLWLVRHHLKSPFILLNGDIIFDSESLYKMLHSENKISLGIRSSDSFDDDDMKVVLQDGLVKKIGKKLNFTEANAESLGMICFSKIGGEILIKHLEDQMFYPENLNKFYLQTIQAMIDKGVQVHPCDLTGGNWFELDFPADFEVMKANIGKISTILK